MAQDMNFWEAVKKIRARDDRFKPELYAFIMEALEYTLGKIGRRRHVSSIELLDGMCEYARQRYGLLARDVISSWGGKSGFDIGLAVFQLVEAGVLHKQETDRLEDFDVEYDLRARLEDDYFEG